MSLRMTDGGAFELHYTGKGPLSGPDRVLASADTREELEAYLLLATGMLFEGRVPAGLHSVAGKFEVVRRAASAGCGEEAAQ